MNVPPSRTKTAKLETYDPRRPRSFWTRKKREAKTPKEEVLASETRISVAVPAGSAACPDFE